MSLIYHFRVLLPAALWFYMGWGCTKRVEAAKADKTIAVQKNPIPSTENGAVQQQVHRAQDHASNQRNPGNQHNTDDKVSNQDAKNKHHQADSVPIFILADITIVAGTTQPLTLAVKGDAAGYIIHSISITKGTTTSYVDRFGLTSLKHQSISSAGMTFNLVADQQLKPASYLLKMRVGKVGMGSRITERLITCTITVADADKEHIAKQLGEATKVKVKQELDLRKPLEATCVNEKPACKPIADAVTSVKGECTSMQSETDHLQSYKTKTEDCEIQYEAITCKAGNPTTIYYDNYEKDLANCIIKNVQIIRQGNTGSSPKKESGLNNYNGKPFQGSITFIAPHIIKKKNEPNSYSLIIKIKKPSNQLCLLVRNIEVTP